MNQQAYEQGFQQRWSQLEKSAGLGDLLVDPTTLGLAGIHGLEGAGLGYALSSPENAGRNAVLGGLGGGALGLGLGALLRSYPEFVLEPNARRWLAAQMQGGR